MTEVAVATARPARHVRQRMSRDDIIMRGAMGLLGLFLLVAIVLPLYTMLSKSFETFTYRFETIEFQVDKGDGVGWGETLNALTRLVFMGRKPRNMHRTCSFLQHRCISRLHCLYHNGHRNYWCLEYQSLPR